MALIPLQQGIEFNFIIISKKKDNRFPNCPMKNWFSKIICTSIFLLNISLMFGQNTLDKIGLTSATPASASYSLRKMSTAYTGPLVRITIGTNYYDVYPDATSGLFATTSPISAAITTYNAAVAAASANTLSAIITAGTTTATVAIWYDQSGNANNVIQATTANQPRIINQGTIETLNGMPTMRFIGSSSSFMESVNNVSINGASSVNAVSRNLTSSANSASIVTTKAVTAKDGLTAATASTSAYQIKQDFPSATDGFYWIQNANINGGTPIKIYADMTTDGGGWTLIMKNSNNSGWTYANTISLNTTMPYTSTADVISTSTVNYSIVGWADYIKKSASGFQYMIDASSRKSYGGIWTANGAYSFINGTNSQSNVTINTKFGLNGSVGTWTYNDAGIEQYMPWYSNCSGYLTTSNACGGGSWWGTLISQPTWSPAPWISGGCGTEGCMQNPGIIWYWVR